MAHSKVKRIFSLLLIFSLVFSSFGAAFAQTGSDWDQHWAKQEIKEWLDKGLIKGYSDGSFKPNHSITRAEFMTLVNKSIGFSDLSDVNYPDIPSNVWYASEVAKAKAAGYISGYRDGTIKPKEPISRQEVAIVIARIKNLGENKLAAARFSDRIQDWSAGSVGAVVEAGLMGGYPDGTFKPEKSITRAEAVVTLKRAITPEVKVEETAKTYDQAGTFGPDTDVQTVEGDVIVNASGVTLQNMVIKGDLLLSKDIAEGDVTLKKVTVEGKTTVLGGGENSIILIDSLLGQVTINKENGKIRIVASGSTSVSGVDLLSSAKLEEKDLTGEGYQNITISERVAADAKIVLVGQFDLVELSGDDLTVDISSGSQVKEMKIDSAAKVRGNGVVDLAYINVNGVSFERLPIKLVTATGVTVSTMSSSGGGDSDEGGSSTTIKSISNVIESVDAGVEFELPAEVEAQLSNNNKENVAVTWTAPEGVTVVDGKVTFMTAGTYEFTGKVTKYGGFNGVKLVLTVDAPQANLTSLEVSSGTLSPEYSAEVTAYTVQLPHGATQVPEVTAEPISAEAEVIVTDAAGLPGLTVVEVTAANGTKKIYSVSFIVGKNNDANLKELSVSAGVLEPNFSADITEYQVELPFGTTTVPTVTAVANDTNANVVVTPATALPGTTTVKVTAEDGETEKTYTVNFTVAANTDATLASLTVNAGTLTPAFAADTLTYNVELP